MGDGERLRGNGFSNWSDGNVLGRGGGGNTGDGGERRLGGGSFIVLRDGGSGGGFFPDIDGGLVDGADESQDPLIHGPAFNRNEGHAGAGSSGDGDEGPFEENREGEGIDDDSEDDAAGELEKLFESHVPDEAELILGDVLGNGVLLNGHIDRPLAWLFSVYQDTAKGGGRKGLSRLFLSGGGEESEEDRVGS